MRLPDPVRHLFLMASCLVAGIAQAEQPFDITYCATGTMTKLASVEGLDIFVLDAKGVGFGNEGSKAFENVTFHCNMLGRVAAGKPSATGYCKYMDPDGDLVVWEVSVSGPDDRYKALQGTGKWKGIKAEGAAVLITKAKPISPELRQVCRRFKGTFEVPKPAS